MRSFLSPTLQISFALMSLTISLLMSAQVLGILPSQSESQLAARAQIAEALAVQLSTAAAKNDLSSINATLASVVAREKTILSGRYSQGRPNDTGAVGATMPSSGSVQAPTTRPRRTSECRSAIPTLIGDAWRLFSQRWTPRRSRHCAERYRSTDGLSWPSRFCGVLFRLAQCAARDRPKQRHPPARSGGLRCSHGGSTGRG